MTTHILMYSTNQTSPGLSRTLKCLDKGHSHTVWLLYLAFGVLYLTFGPYRTPNNLKVQEAFLTLYQTTKFHPCPN